MKILIIGGTVFLGRHLVDAARRRGHQLTLFNRGRHNPELHPDIPKLRGDRTSDLTALQGRTWDVVIDTCAFTPADANASARALAGSVRRYIFVSSIAVYRDWPASPVRESSPAFREGDGPDSDYGALKAGCERVFEKLLPGRVLHVRAGLLLGPYENIGRLPYWLHRVSGYPEIIAPGNPERRLQLLDARDLADWIISSAEQGRTGIINVAGRPRSVSMRAFLEFCKTVTGSSSRLVWTSDELLLQHGVEPWSELPLWMPQDQGPSVFDVNIDRALETGLRFCPWTETVRATWSWLLDGGTPGDAHRQHMEAPTLTRAKELGLLAVTPS
ncbi:MAG: hypothetical protein H0T12_04835 [Actinobacteria bacterium]|nr:hypothetical protein [Actinomycetota bacterium]